MKHYKSKIIIRATTIPQSLVFFEGTIKELSQHYEVQLLSSSGESLDNMGEKYGVKTHGVEMYRRLSPMKDIRSLLRIIKVLRKEKPCMVHSMTPKAGLLCMLAAWWKKIPVRVHTFTGLVWPTESGWKRKLLMLTDKITCACATNIIPEGEGVKNDLINNGITHKPIKVLGYGNVKGIDMTRFSRRPEVMEKTIKLIDKESFTFIFVGRIVRDKGINELCEAFDQLNKKFSYTRLFLVGDYENGLDPISESSKKIIESNPSIFAVGPKYGDDLLAYYASSDCFVFPSYREGFPNTVLEAGAMGLPSIVTNINGSREIIIEGENGIIIPPKDQNALFEAMKKVLLEVEWKDYMASNARQLIFDRYEQSFVQKCLMDFYEELLN